LEFNIETLVLHGNLPPAKGKPFSCQVFFFNNDLEEWSVFCRENMNGLGYNHNYDIFIGPLCIASSSPMKPIQLNSTEVPTIQIAFCTKRSVRWLNKHVAKIYLEEHCKDWVSTISLNYLSSHHRCSCPI
jgi:hypothetical protein